MTNYLSVTLAECIPLPSLPLTPSLSPSLPRPFSQHSIPPHLSLPTPFPHDLCFSKREEVWDDSRVPSSSLPASLILILLIYLPFHAVTCLSVPARVCAHVCVCVSAHLPD